MKNKEKLESLERFKKWFDGKSAFALIIIITVILSAVTSFFICKTIYKYQFIYPEKEYQQLEDEFYNIIDTNNQINFDKLSDQSIELKKVDIVYNHSKEYEISLSKPVKNTFSNNIKIFAKFSGSINKDSITFQRDYTKEVYTIVFTLVCIGCFIIVLIIFLVIMLLAIVLPTETFLIKKINKLSYLNEEEPH